MIANEIVMCHRVTINRVKYFGCNQSVSGYKASFYIRAVAVVNAPGQAQVRRKLGSESVKTQFSKINFLQMYFLMAMNSHICLSGASHADMHLTGYISHRACVLWACISEVYNSEARISWACISEA
jgi:hypothetical protein